MADVFPQRDLPGRSEEWGRKVEDRIVAGETSETQLEQKVDNGLRATAGQLAVIANQLETVNSQQQLILDQQKDLQGRESHAVFWSNASFTVSSNVSNVNLPQLAVSYSLEETRVVKVQTTLNVSASRGLSALNAAFFLFHNQDPLPPLFHETTGADFVQGDLDGVSTGQITVTSVFSRPPGDYVVTPQYSTLVTPNGYVVVIDGSTVVDVLQRVQ